MKYRLLVYVSVMLMVLSQGFSLNALAEDGEITRRLTVLGNQESLGGASGLVKISFSSGAKPYQRFQVVAVGLEPNTEYNLTVNGMTLDSRLSDQNGSIEFLYTTKGKEAQTEGAILLPKEIGNVLSIQNVTIRNREQEVALIGTFEREASGAINSSNQQLNMFNNFTIEGGKQITITMPFSDPDGDPLTLSVKCDRGNFITSSGMSMIVSPREADVGTSVCTATATDPFGLSSSVAFIVNVIPPNKPPVLSPIPDQIVSSGNAKTVTLQATDVEGNAGLRFSLLSAPGFVILSDNGDGSGTLRLMPSLTETQGGIVTVRVTDAGGLTDQTSFTVTVQKTIQISAVSSTKPNLFISGIGFGSSGARVNINGVDASARIIGQSDNSITLKGSNKKLGLRKGPNQIQVTANGITSNTFIINLLDDIDE